MICKKCGQCCHYLFRGKMKACKHLINNLCDMYETRLFKKIDIGTFCLPRERIKTNYINCPYNKV